MRMWYCYRKKKNDQRNMLSVCLPISSVMCQASAPYVSEIQLTSHWTDPRLVPLPSSGRRRLLSVASGSSPCSSLPPRSSCSSSHLETTLSGPRQSFLLPEFLASSRRTKFPSRHRRSSKSPGTAGAQRPGTSGNRSSGRRTGFGFCSLRRWGLRGLHTVALRRVAPPDHSPAFPVRSCCRCETSRRCRGNSCSMGPRTGPRAVPRFSCTGSPLGAGACWFRGPPVSRRSPSGIRRSFSDCRSNRCTARSCRPHHHAEPLPPSPPFRPGPTRPGNIDCATRGYHHRSRRRAWLRCCSLPHSRCCCSHSCCNLPHLPCWSRNHHYCTGSSEARPADTHRQPRRSCSRQHLPSVNCSTVACS
mmetsp:Transcript_18029/g.45100  ORF Transcript_18029/g.45100 Transcript_18029/m.45100 type:complete len:360 (+) Transcript_18029:460-1539(+)